MAQTFSTFMNDTFNGLRGDMRLLTETDSTSAAELEKTCGCEFDCDCDAFVEVEPSKPCGCEFDCDCDAFVEVEPPKPCGCDVACDCDQSEFAILLEPDGSNENFHLDARPDPVFVNGGFFAPVGDGVVGDAATEFNIDLEYSGPAEFLDEFEDAIEIWESVITADLPDILFNGELYDDLTIEATIEPIDGPFGILGSAGPDFVRGGTALPFLGSMRFDEDDIAFLDSSGTLQDVIIHEIGHVLGIGTLWGFAGLMDADFRYTGANALAEYRALTMSDNAYNPVEEDFGVGTAGGHWDETLFNTELMTGFAEGAGTAMPLSRVTIASLEDLGYTVDYGEADAFALPLGAPADDFSASIGTTGSVAVNGADATGNVATGGDTDWFAVTLQAGVEYTIDLRGDDTGGGTLPDAYIHGIFDSSGNLIASTQDNNSGTDSDAQVTFTPQTDGDYFVAAGAFAARTGTYSLSVEGDEAIILPVLVRDENDVTVTTTATLAEALLESDDMYDIIVGPDYEPASETASVEHNLLTIQMAAGLSTPNLELESGVANITVSGAGDINVLGNEIANAINGSEGNSRFEGGGGADRLVGRGGDDTLDGGTGNDTINGGQGNDIIVGGLDNDSLLGAGSDDSIEGNQGADSLFGGAGFDTISGGSEADSILGQSNDDVLEGDGGEDIIRGGAGNDLIEGGADADMLFGNGNNDTIDGGGGNDFLQGAAGADVLSGDAGDDTLTGGNAGDQLDGGTGNDLLIGGSSDGARDTFVFEINYDVDRINGFEAGIDRIQLDEALWETAFPLGLTEQEVVDTFGSLNGNGTILTLDFGGDDILEVQNSGGMTLATLGADIVFI